MKSAGRNTFLKTLSRQEQAPKADAMKATSVPLKMFSPVRK
jgi:hypothetical protein